MFQPTIYNMNNMPYTAHEWNLQDLGTALPAHNTQQGPISPKPNSDRSEVDSEESGDMNYYAESGTMPANTVYYHPEQEVLEPPLYDQQLAQPTMHQSADGSISWSITAYPGERTGHFYTTIANLPHHTDGHNIRAYFKEHGLKVSSGEVSGTGSGWVCVEDFNAHVRIQKIVRKHLFLGRRLIADGSNSIKPTRIVTFKERTARKIGQVNMQASFISDLLSPLGLYDPSYNEHDLDVRDDKSIPQPTHSEAPCLELDPEEHRAFIANVSEIIEVPLDRFPPLHYCSQPSATRSLYYANYYWTAHPTRPGNKFLPRPTTVADPPHIIYPTDITRLKIGYKLPHLCSVVVETASKQEVLDCLYGIRIFFDEEGRTTAEAQAWWVDKEVARKATKKLHKASIAKMHVLSKLGTPFRPPVV